MKLKPLWTKYGGCRYTPVCCLVAILFNSCTAGKNLPGTYYHSMSPNEETLLIRQDGTFSFNIYSDIFGTKTIRGKWRVANSILTTTRDTIPVSYDFVKVTEIVRTGMRKITVHIIDENDKTPLLGAEVHINGAIRKYIIDTTGSVIIPVVGDLAHVSFSYLSASKSVIIKDPGIKDITFAVDFEKMPHVSAFTVPIRWLVNRHKLIALDRDGASTSPVYFIKKR